MPQEGTEMRQALGFMQVPVGKSSQTFGQLDFSQVSLCIELFSYHDHVMTFRERFKDHCLEADFLSSFYTVLQSYILPIIIRRRKNDLYGSGTRRVGGASSHDRDD